MHPPRVLPLYVRLSALEMRPAPARCAMTARPSRPSTASRASAERIGVIEHREHWHTASRATRTGRPPSRAHRSRPVGRCSGSAEQRGTLRCEFLRRRGRKNTDRRRRQEGRSPRPRAAGCSRPRLNVWWRHGTRCTADSAPRGHSSTDAVTRLVPPQALASTSDRNSRRNRFAHSRRRPRRPLDSHADCHQKSLMSPWNQGLSPSFSPG